MRYEPGRVYGWRYDDDATVPTLVLDAQDRSAEVLPDCYEESCLPCILGISHSRAVHWAKVTGPLVKLTRA